MPANKSEFGDQLLDFQRRKREAEAKKAGFGELFDAFSGKNPTTGQAVAELAKRITLMERDEAAARKAADDYRASSAAATGLLSQLVKTGVLKRNQAYPVTKDGVAMMLTVAGPSDDVCVFVLVPVAG